MTPREYRKRAGLKESPLQLGQPVVAPSGRRGWVQSIDYVKETIGVEWAENSYKTDAWFPWSELTGEPEKKSALITFEQMEEASK